MSKSSVDTFRYALSNMYHHFKVQKDRFGSLNFMKYEVKVFIFYFPVNCGICFLQLSVYLNHVNNTAQGLNFFLPNDIEMWEPEQMVRVY